MPSSVVDDDAALERRKSAIVKLMLEGIRPAAGSPGRPLTGACAGAGA